MNNNPLIRTFKIKDQNGLELGIGTNILKVPYIDIIPLLSMTPMLSDDGSTDGETEAVSQVFAPITSLYGIMYLMEVIPLLQSGSGEEVEIPPFIPMPEEYLNSYPKEPGTYYTTPDSDIVEGAMYLHSTFSVSPTIIKSSDVVSGEGIPVDIDITSIQYHDTLSCLATGMAKFIPSLFSALTGGGAIDTVIMSLAMGLLMLPGNSIAIVNIESGDVNQTMISPDLTVLLDNIM